MSENEKKGITVKIDASLHAQVRQYIEEKGITMAEFVSKALDDELHPQNNITEVKNMSNMRTMAFQVPEELFQRIKDYLRVHNMSQKQFVLGLIKNELDRDMAMREQQTVSAEHKSSEESEDQEADEDEQQSDTIADDIADAIDDEEISEELSDESSEGSSEETDEDAEYDNEEVSEESTEDPEMDMSM